ncbi:MAG TPA: type II toxin-antitoxin system CcdA family antitoxin [Streptosporangiaceae bacterium]|jgi:hypothetical protein
MAKTSVYLPDDLAEQVRAYGISISEVTQRALRKAVDEARIKEDVMTDIQAVAERLSALQRQATAESRAENMRVRALGTEWARTRATAAELEAVAMYESGPYQTPSTLFPLLLRSSGGEKQPVEPGDVRWEHFQAGVHEVWAAVKPLLS